MFPSIVRHSFMEERRIVRHSLQLSPFFVLLLLKETQAGGLACALDGRMLGEHWQNGGEPAEEADSMLQDKVGLSMSAPAELTTSKTDESGDETGTDKPSLLSCLEGDPYL